MQNNAASDPPHDPAYPHPGDTFQTAGSTSNANASPGSGSNLVPVAAVRAQVQEPPPPAAGLPHAMLPNTLLVPARWPALLMESLAPAASTIHYNSTATTPAAYGSLPNTYANRGRFVSVADVRALDALEFARGLAPNPDEAAAAARAPSTPANVPSRTCMQISTTAGPSPAITHACRDAAAVGRGQTPAAAVGLWHASVGRDDSTSDADKRAVVGVESDDATKAAEDDEELSSEDESEEYEVDSEDDEDDDEDDDQQDEDDDQQDEDDDQQDEDDDQQDEEEDDEEDVRLRLRVTSPMHRWLGCQRRDH